MMRFFGKGNEIGKRNKNAKIFELKLSLINNNKTIYDLNKRLALFFEAKELISDVTIYH